MIIKCPLLSAIKRFLNRNNSGRSNERVMEVIEVSVVVGNNAGIVCPLSRSNGVILARVPAQTRVSRVVAVRAIGGGNNAVGVGRVNADVRLGASRGRN